MMKRVAVFLLACLLCIAYVPCAARAVSDSVGHGRYALYYYCDRIDIDRDYLDNAEQIFRIKNILMHATRIDSITIYSYASPEGPLKRNIWLSEKRALAAREFILENLPDSTVLSPDNIRLRPMGENWDGLVAELEANYHLPNRDRVLKIVRANIPSETKKWRLKRLDNNYTYSWIIRKHMPRLRMATWVCVHAPLKELVIDFENDSIKFPRSIKPLDLKVPVDSSKRKTIFALKTNLLYDVLSFANFSVEVPIGKKYSVLYYHQFPWWRWGAAKNEHCVRFLSIGAEGRWWFKPAYRNRRDKLTGHFVGIYAESGKWDFQWDRNICHQGEHWSAGLSYGYSMPLGKYFNLEFSVSVGYASIPYRKYIPSEDYEILWRDPDNHGTWSYIGPTKAQVSLVLPITVKTGKKGGWR
jgi:hypothetical protein